MFRRRSSDAPGLVDQTVPGSAADDDQTRPARPGQTPPKGAPTPKRSAAEANRRQERARRSQALQRGEQWALPRKDQGPVRALARDVVDSRRGIGEYYMFMVVLLIVLLVLPGNSTKLIADVVVVGLLLLIIGEGWTVGNKVKRMAAERFPGQSTQGVVMYTTMRGISMRRMRMPKPRVNRGDKV